MKSLIPKSKFEFIISMLLIIIVVVSLIAFVGVLGVNSSLKSNSELKKDYGPSTVNSIIQTSDEGYAFVGRYGSSFSNYYRGGKQWTAGYYLTKLDASGNVLWRNTYSQIIGESKLIGQTKDGGFVVFGSGNSGYACVVKTDSKGSVDWYNQFSSVSNYYFGGVTSRDGDILIYGTTQINYNYPYSESVETYVEKIDSGGRQVWKQNFSDTNFDILPKSAVQLDNGNFVLIGEASQYYLWFGLLDSSGNILANKSYFDTVSGINTADTIKIGYDTVSLAQADDNGCIVGIQHSVDNYYPAYGYGASYKQIRFNQNGDIKWNHTINNNSASNIIATFQAHDGGYIGVGTDSNSYSLLLVKTDDSGATVWTQKTDKYNQLKNYALTKDGGFILAGNAPYGDDGYFSTVWLMKFNSANTQTNNIASTTSPWLVTIILMVAIIASGAAVSATIVYKYNKQEKQELQPESS
jgi:hypothetical protein